MAEESKAYYGKDLKQQTVLVEHPINVTVVHDEATWVSYATGIGAVLAAIVAVLGIIKYFRSKRSQLL